MIRSILNWLFYQWGYAAAIVGNEHGFIHKKLLGIGRGLVGKVAGTALGFIPGGGLIKTGLGVAGGLIGRQFRPRGRALVPRTTTARPTMVSQEQKQVALNHKFAPAASQVPPGAVAPTFLDPKGSGRFDACPPGFIWSSPWCLPPGVGVTPGVAPGTDCPPPLIRNPSTGNCIAPTSPRGAELFMGEATMGKYGAALIPGTKIIDRAVCLPGMQLGDDGLCYNKGNISNKQRMWPAGRKPLLTGGELRAISTAARAGRRMELATKRLQKMGMMKKPASRRAHPALRIPVHKSVDV